MSYRYTSLEDGQVIETEEPREDLDELARWRRDDVAGSTEPTGLVPSGQEPVAGPVNTAAVTGGDPPLTSATAGVANPAETLSTEQAAAQAAKDLEQGVPPLSEQPPHVPNTVPPSAPADQAGKVERPARNATTEEWANYAKQEGVNVAEDAGRDDIIAAYIDAKAPGGNASREAWAEWASAHDVAPGDLKRDEIRDAVITAGWAKA